MRRQQGHGTGDLSVTDRKQMDQQGGAGDAPPRDTTTHTGNADPNRAADLMKDQDQGKAGKANTGGMGTSEGADTDGAGSGGMIEGEDAGGGPAGTGGSSGAAG